MHITNTIDVTDRYLTSEEAGAVASGIRAGHAFDIGFFGVRSTEALLSEFLSLESPYAALTPPVFSQLLVTRKGVLSAWGTMAREEVNTVDLTRYPQLSLLLCNLMSISDALRSPNEQLLLSVLPALGRTRPSPRFYHRESHSSLEQLEMEGASPAIYRMCCDLGLKNSWEVINVDLARRDMMLQPDGRLSPAYRNLFQRDYIDYNSKGNLRDASSGELTEDMLAFSGEKRGLIPGRAFIWSDDIFFHAPYLRRGHTIYEMEQKPRSVVIVNEFCSNRFREIPWPTPLRELLAELVEL